jgi:hypothetical protein
MHLPSKACREVPMTKTASDVSRIVCGGLVVPCPLGVKTACCQNRVGSYCIKGGVMCSSTTDTCVLFIVSVGWRYLCEVQPKVDCIRLHWA